MNRPQETDKLDENVSASRLSSNVVEVTNSCGGVGFVAVGRFKKSNSQNKVHLKSFKSSSHSATDSEEHTSIRCTWQQNRPECMTYHGGDTNMNKSMTTRQNFSSSSRNRSEPQISLHENSYTIPKSTQRRCSYTPDLPLENNEYVKNFKHTVKNSKETNYAEKTFQDQDSSHNYKRSRRTSNSMEVEQSVDETSMDSTTADENLLNLSDNAHPLCKLCGQRHRLSENHEYDYVKDIDDDLQCDICLQPFVDPYDTKCGHTFCCVCLQNYVRLKSMCPIDRNEINFVTSDCWQSSLVIRKLVDKLSVQCPNKNYCKLILPRTDLAAHLKERCPGTRLRCTKSMFGCSYKGPRKDLKDHLRQCKYQQYEGNPVDHVYPDCTKYNFELFRPEGTAELGLSIVGGNDTPLRNIIVQNILPGSLVAEDGRIMPGDIIIEINGEDLHNASHVEARTLLSRSSHLMKFAILREKALEVVEHFQTHESNVTERISVSLLKPPSDQLGIKITTCDDGTMGIFILELVPGRVAHANGQLQIGDRILEISNVDLQNATPEIAAQVIQNSGERVDIVVSRITPSTIVNPWAMEKTLPRNSSGHLLKTLPKQQTLKIPVPESIPMNATYTEKRIFVKKAAQESLGIIVSGGMTGTRGDLPVFVQDVQPLGVLGKDKKLQRGDLLVQVNGVDLNGMSHVQAIAVLKDTAQHCKDVSLVALELDYNGKAEDFAIWEELSNVHHQRNRRGSVKSGSAWSTWTPSWKMWLAVPPQCRVPRNVVIRRSSRCGLGFSIVGGRVENDGASLPIFVKYVVPGSPAEVQGGLKCGDEIVAINGRDASAMTHSNAVQALKRSPGSTALTVMSWPGSIH